MLQQIRGETIVSLILRDYRVAGKVKRYLLEIPLDLYLFYVKETSSIATLEETFLRDLKKLKHFLIIEEEEEETKVKAKVMKVGK